MLGNYMNGSSLQGGAFGLRVSSINKVKGIFFHEFFLN